MSASVSSALPVLISGSGLCGLLVARALTTHSIPFLIFERDETSVKRAQGYRLRMSNEGLQAIQDILPEQAWKEFRAGVATTGGGGLQRVDAFSGEKTVVQAPPPAASSSSPTKEPAAEVTGLGPKGEIYGVSRAYLREQLMKTLEDKVQYGKRVVSYTRTPEGVIAQFADGTKSPLGSLLIGADGVHSAVARQLTNGAVKVYDTQTRMIHGQTTTTAFKALGEGVFSMSDADGRKDGKFVRVICNVRPGEMNDPTVTFGWTMAGSPGTIEVPGNKFQVVGQAAADLARKITASWSDDLRPIFEQQVADEAGFWKMTTSSPDGVPQWTNDARVTIVGDAAHSMTPAGGNGANTALQTASILGKVLRKHNGWSDTATKDFEDEMRPLASANVQRSFEMAKSMFDIGKLVEDVRDDTRHTPSS